MKPLAIDLFCGLGGWTEGLLVEGYDVVGFDGARGAGISASARDHAHAVSADKAGDFEVVTTEQSPHTPGPWRVNGLTVESATGGNICLVNLARPKGPTEANLALISAAPDLLALAKQCASECAHCSGEGCVRANDDDPAQDVNGLIDCDCCADIRAVIAKAEGRS